MRSWSTVKSLLVLFLALLGACSNSEMPTVEVIDDEPAFVPAGMGYVAAANKEVILGTNDENAYFTERPQMRVKFTYDFYMGYREVTWREYREGMGFNDSLTDTLSDTLSRIADITYYDAVLFANAMSKRNGLDTVYTYSFAEYDTQGACILLVGLETHYEVNAYRLPTEAEWMFVAYEHWNDTCSADGQSFCDFAGSLKEWTNDWLGRYSDTTLTNYVGVANGGSQFSRVVKGGSYRDSGTVVHPYDRMDVYTVTSDMKSDYVGIRLAFGSIPEYTTTDLSGKVVSSDIRITATSEQMRDKLYTMRSKLAFRNDVTGNLVYVDFVSGNPVYHEIAGDMEVFHPEISPNGRYVAFSTKPEGVSGESYVYVRELASVTPTIKKLPVSGAAIPRWRVLDNGDTVIVYVTDAGNNSDNASFAQKETWQVVFSNGVFRKKTRLFAGAYHDGISDDWRLAVSGARKLRARLAEPGSTVKESARDTVWFGGDQACNASLSQDGTKRTMFLDFAGKTGKEFVGHGYGVHEMLFVADSTGKLIQAIPSPEGYAFDHTEWVPGYNLAVATLTDVNGAHKKIVLLDLSDSSTVDLAEGEELMHPSLWAYGAISHDADDALDIDSAGVYMRPNGSFEMSLYRYKLELLWRYRDTAEVVMLGSSRSLSGFDATYIRSHFAINLSQTPNSIYGTRDFFKRYVLGNVRNLRYLFVSLDIDFWYKTDGESGDNFFYQDYRSYPGFVYDENHGYWKDDRSDRILRYTEASLGSEEAEKILFHRGIYVGNARGWGTTPSLLNDSTWYGQDPQLFDSSFAALEEIVKAARDEGVVVVGVIFPQSPAYKETGSFGRYGLLRSEAPALIASIAALEETYDNFHLVDENRMGDHDYDSSMAENEDHLSKSGAHILSRRLDSLLTAWENP
jgi:uncharacterized protein (TIGR02171 family)